jgi:hypothetical protein
MAGVYAERRKELATADATGIFQRLANQSAFIDKAVFSVWGERRERDPSTLEFGQNRAVGGSKRMYSRLIPGTCRLSGNPFELKYGRLHPYSNVPPFRLSVRSDAVPLSGAQASIVAGSLFRRGFRCQVSQVEFTFDTTELSPEFFRDHLITTAHSVKEVGKEGSKTLYVGGPRSLWQLRIYRKADSLMRVEFVLRRGYLQAHSIQRIDDLLRLRGLDVWAAASFPEFNEERLASVLKTMPMCWGKNILSQEPRRRTLRFLAGVLRWRCGVAPTPLLRHSQGDVLLRRMQRNMLW